MDAQVRYRATNVRTWSDSDYNYTQTSHFMVHRGGSVGFEHVPVDGSVKMPDDLMESIEPYDFSGGGGFQTAYLAGYLADRYDVTAEASIDRAKQRVKRSTEEAFPERLRDIPPLQRKTAVCSFMAGKPVMRFIQFGFSIQPGTVINTLLP